MQLQIMRGSNRHRVTRLLALSLAAVVLGSANPTKWLSSSRIPISLMSLSSFSLQKNWEEGKPRDDNPL